jgi:hypothetical protein
MMLNVQRDESDRRRCRIAFAAIVITMPLVLLAMALTSGASLELKLLPMLLWLIGSAIIGHIFFVRPLRSYRCPQCQRALLRAEDARPWFRFRCETCGVEWDPERSDGEGK